VDTSATQGRPYSPFTLSLSQGEPQVFQQLFSDLPVSVRVCKVGLEGDDRRPPAARLGRGVVKRAYEGEPGQQRADALTLDAHPLPVDQPHHGQAGRTALREIFLDHAAHLVRRKW